MEFITPNWPAPSNVKALSTTRTGGASHAPFDGFNLGKHVGDDEQAVSENRTRLVTAGGLPCSPVWLNQTHSTVAVELHHPTDDVLEGDASFTRKPNVVCCVMTADCLPVLLTDREGTQVAAIHAGWRGLLDGVIEHTVEQFEHSDLIAWFGPSIGPRAFEVGDEVRQLFMQKDHQAQKAFVAGKQPGKWLADIDMLATQRLNILGIKNIYYSDICTFENTDTFFSYRHEGQTGRQASLIWLE